MRQHHDSQYDSSASSYSGDHSFWTVLFIDLDRSWNLTGSAQLEHRFTWVLELIRTGSLPAHAEVAAKILQKSLSGTAFKRETHPYNYETQCLTRKFVNPDLSPEWVKDFLLANDALSAVERDIKKDLKGYDIGGFCAMYGILITQLREQAMAEQGHFYPGLGLVRSQATTCAPHQASESFTAQETQACLEPVTDEPDNLLPRSPPPYPPLRGHAVTKKSTRWEPHEINYLKYLMELSISQKEMLTKFHGRFGEYRTLQSLTTQIKLLRRVARTRGKQDTSPIENTEQTLWDKTSQPDSLDSPQPMQKESPQRPVSLEQKTTRQPTRQRDTTARKESAARTYLKDQGDEKCEYLQSLLQAHDSWDPITRAMKERFGNKGSTQAFQSIASLEKMDTSRLSGRRRTKWTAEEHAFLEPLLEHPNTWRAVLDALEAESPQGRTMEAVRNYATTHGMDVSKVVRPTKWTPQEDDILRDISESTASRSELVIRFLERVGPGRTQGAIIERTQRLGLLRYKLWSEGELQNVRDHSHLPLKRFCAQFWEKFGYDRTLSTIKERRRMLAHKDD